MEVVVQIMPDLGKDKAYGWQIVGDAEQHRCAILDVDIDVDSTEGVVEKILSVANNLRVNNQSKLLDSSNEYIYHMFRKDWTKHWKSASLHIKKGYNGYLALIVVDGQKVYEDWVDNMGGLKSVYNYCKKYVLERYAGYKEFILFLSPFEVRINKRPTETDDGYLKLTVMDAVQRDTGLDIPSILKGLKDLGLGNFANIKVRKDIIEILDDALRKANAKDKAYIENQYNTLLFNSLCGVTFKKGLPCVYPLSKSSLTFILELDAVALRTLGYFKVAAKSSISIYEVLGIDPKDTNLTDELYAKLKYYSYESIQDRKNLKELSLQDAVSVASLVSLANLLTGISDVMDEQCIEIDSYYCIKDKDELLLFLEEQPECYVDAIKIKEKVMQEPNVEYWYEVSESEVVDIKAVTRENVGDFLNLSEEEKLLVGKFEY